jgi:hypothetical protein
MSRIFNSPFGFIDLGRIIRITPVSEFNIFAIHVELGTPMYVEWEQPNGSDWREKWNPKREQFLSDYRALVEAWQRYVEQSAVAKTPPVG